jgi:hypothetical protein
MLNQRFIFLFDLFTTPLGGVYFFLNMDTFDKPPI